MGVLDDAIREHLELKRKHGVAEDEVQRQEEEALGPARRDVAQQHEEEAEPAADGAAEPVADPAAVEQETAPEAEATAIPEPAAAEPPPAEPPAAHEPDVPALAEEPPVAGQLSVGQEPDIGSHAPAHEEVEPHQLAEPDEPDSRDARLGDTQPHGFDALDEDEAAEDEPGEDEPDEPGQDEPDDQDVLEDTPDFLQETPEHDRLWFEQKPPRDFDFD